MTGIDIIKLIECHLIICHKTNISYNFGPTNFVVANKGSSLKLYPSTQRGDTLKNLTESRLKQYFAGELKRKVLIFKNKAKEKVPDELYDTNKSIVLRHDKAATYSAKSDPTGNTATKIADMRLRRSRTYKRYLLMNNVITDVINQQNEENIYLLKVYLEIIGGGITAAARELHISNLKAERKIKGLLNLFDRKITAALINGKFPDE